MDIIVCVKRTPLTQEVDLEIDGTKRDIKKDPLAWFINEWDNYAIEAAVQLKEKFDGTVTAVTIGHEDDEEVLRRCLAIGADRAVRIDPGNLALDAYLISSILAEFIRGLKYDLILTGVQGSDLNNGMVGTMLAEHLGIAHSAVVTGIEAEGTALKIKMELEGGIDELARIALPALLTIQTGINEPRYVSIMGIRKASKKELNVIRAEDLIPAKEALVPWTFVEEVYQPPETEGAAMMEGDPEKIADEIIRIIKEKGVDL